MKNALIYGYGVTGKGAHKLLKNNNYSVEIYDDSSTKEVKFDKIDIIIKSPGIPEGKPLLIEAEKRGIEVISEIELGYRFSKYKIIAVTGTNGKTTIVTKTKELLEKAGYKVEAAGNIGKTFSEIVCENKKLDYIILELSSYQLERVYDFRPDIALITNLSPDHLDRYESLESYYLSKFNIIQNLREQDYFIINDDDDNIKRILAKFAKNFKTKTISMDNEKSDYYFNKEDIYIGKDQLISKFELSLNSNPNIENSLFIVAIASILDINNETLKEFLKETAPIEHRMEKFFTYKNSIFINDSKGTNIDSTIKALEGFEEKVTLICGGKDKKLNLVSLAEVIAKKSKQVFLIGETANSLESFIIEKGFDEKKIRNLKKIENVINELKEKIDEEKNIILFSPAASSFDQYLNYEERGKRFKELVFEKFGGKVE